MKQSFKQIKNNIDILDIDEYFKERLLFIALGTHEANKEIKKSIGLQFKYFK